jgi:hypothetical protein
MSDTRFYERNSNLFGFIAIQEKIRFIQNANIDRSNLTRVVDINDLSLGKVGVSDCIDSVKSNNIYNLELILSEFSNVVMLTVPYNKEFLYEESVYETFFNLIEDLSEKYNVPYYNYSFNEELNKAEYFYDRLHLNNIGQQKFMEYIFHEFVYNHVTKLTFD